MAEQDVKARDGRNLRVREAGAEDGMAVFVHHGTPMAGLLWKPWTEDAKRRGLRLISHDRPGYGGSDPQGKRSVGDVVPDVHDIADHLGIERYATWGISGGGPHTLACAALSGGRCVAAAALASVAPYPAEGLDYFADMGEDNVREIGLAINGDIDELTRLTERDAKEMLAAAPGDIIEGLESLLSEPDRAVLTDDFARFMWECGQVALRSSIAGWLEDDMAFVSDWGFDLRDIRTPVLVYQGRQDLMVPFGHGQWIAARIPSAEARLHEDEGHLTLLVNRVSDTHAWLASLF